MAVHRVWDGAAGWELDTQKQQPAGTSLHKSEHLLGKVFHHEESKAHVRCMSHL